jgi:Transcriptional regulator DIP2311-like, C-terminal domain
LFGFVPGATPAQVPAAGRRGGWDAAGVPTLEHYMKTDAWFAGPPEELVAYLKGLESRYPGLEYVNMSNSIGHAAGRSCSSNSAGSPRRSCRSSARPPGERGGGRKVASSRAKGRINLAGSRDSRGFLPFVNPRRQIALRIAGEQGTVTRRALARVCGISGETARQELAALAHLGYLRRVGDGRSTEYVLR